MAFTFCTNCGEQIDISLEKCPHCGHPTGAQRNYTYGMDPTSVNRPTQNAQNGNADAPNPNGNTGNGESSGNQSGFGGDNPSNNNQNPYGQNPYGQNQNPYGQNQNPYGQNQNPYGQNQNPYGQNPYGQNQRPYQTPPYGQNPYGQNQYGQTPYGQDPFGNLYRRPVQQKRPLSTGLMVFSILNMVFGCCCFGMVFGIIGLMLAFKAQNSLSDREEIGKKKLSLAMNIIGTILTIVYVVVYVIVFIQAGGDLSAFM